MTGARPFRFAVQGVKAKSWPSGARSPARPRTSATPRCSWPTTTSAGAGDGPARQPLQYVAPIAAMAAAAAVTDTLRIGCRVFCVDYHVPAVLAKEAATLDLLSDGRLEFGIGAGWSEHEYAAMGLTFDARPERVAKLEGVRRAVQGALHRRPVGRPGRCTSRRGYTGPAAPGAAAAPADHDRRAAASVVLSFAGREADIVSLNNVDFVPLNDDGLTPQEEAAPPPRLRAHRGRRPVRRSLDIESRRTSPAITDDADAQPPSEIAGDLGVADRRVLDGTPTC